MSASNKEKTSNSPGGVFYVAGTVARLWAGTGTEVGTESSASQISALLSLVTSSIPLVVGKSIYFLKTPLLIHFLLIRNF